MSCAHAPLTIPLLGALGALAACGAPEGVWPGGDVALVSIDTLRADALSCYGNPRATSPGLDELAAGALRFEHVLAQAPNTATSHATLFTGLEPWTHRVANITSLEHGTPGLHPAFVTLAEQFADAGFHTAALTDGGPLGESWDLLQGFETVHAQYEDVATRVDQALELLDGDDGRPLFLFLHTYEVHEPYLPPPELVERFAGDYDGPLLEALAEVRAEQDLEGARPNGRRMLLGRASFTDEDVAFLRSIYEAELAYADAELARLWPVLIERDALIAVTSDHGEEFGEHGEFGHKQLYDETLRVPLILRLPGGAHGGEVVEDVVSLVDLHPTLLRAASLTPTKGTSGVDLLAALRGEANLGWPSHASTNEHIHPDTATVAWQRSVRTDAYTWVEQIADGGRGARTGRLFDGADRLEVRALFEGDPLAENGASRAAAGLARSVDAQMASAQSLRAQLLSNAAPATFRAGDARTVEELRALGYLDD